MIALAMIACTVDARVAQLEREVDDLRSEVDNLTEEARTGTTRVDQVQQRLDAIETQAEKVRKADTATATPTSLVGRWTIRTEPSTNLGCDTEGSAADYTWDVRRGRGPSAVEIDVDGHTSYPRMRGEVDRGVLSAAGQSHEGSVATFVVWPQGDELTGYRILNPQGDACSIVWRVTGSRQ
jgi:hypothetical protein